MDDYDLYDVLASSATAWSPRRGSRGPRPSTTRRPTGCRACPTRQRPRSARSLASSPAPAPRSWRIPVCSRRPTCCRRRSGGAQAARQPGRDPPRDQGAAVRGVSWSAVPLGDVLALRSEIVHPRDHPNGGATFVGLEHIESGTGRRIGFDVIRPGGTHRSKGQVPRRRHRLRVSASVPQQGLAGRPGRVLFRRIICLFGASKYGRLVRRMVHAKPGVSRSSTD